MVKKEYKIVKTDLFKKQVKNLPKSVKKELDDALKSIVKNPTEAPNSMNIFGPPNAKELRQWMSEVEVTKIDLCLEYLVDKECLTKKGEKLAHEFWKKYIKENPKKKVHNKRRKINNGKNNR